MERTRIHLGADWEVRDVTVPVVAPWTGETIAEQSLAAERDVDVAVAAARQALDDPVRRSDRAAVLDEAAATLVDQGDVFARTIAQEAAKPITAARIEVERAVQTLRFSAAAARTFSGQVVPLDAHPSGPDAIAYTVREPRGVLAAITPFNFPLNLVAHKLGPAIAAGCPVVLKPAERTPLSAIRLVEVLLEAGLPPRNLQLLTGLGPDIVPPLVRHGDVDVVSFTGSARVGRELESLVPHKPVLLELGSAAPLIVERDADLDLAVDRIVAHGFTHAGQSCVAIQRVLVHDSVHDELMAVLTSAVAELRVGDPLDETSALSCVVDDVAAKRIETWVEDAVEGGGTLAIGGKVDGRVVEPTVVTGAPLASKLWQEEVFGPVVAARRFTHADEAIAIVNGPAPVISVGVLTRDMDLVLRYVRDVRAGTVLVNESPTFRADHMPYGGEGSAGNTREGPASAIAELTTEKLVVLRGTR